MLEILDGNVYFKYDYYRGYTLTSVSRWVIKYKAPGELELIASPSGGEVEEGTQVSLTAKYDGSTTNDVTIYYTLDGTRPDRYSPQYYSPITINESCTLNAWVIHWYQGKRITEEYVVKSPDIKVTSITLNKSSLSIQAGQSETLTATVKPDNATDKTVMWSSSNTSIATVDSNGKVTAKSAGTATITCTANGGSNVKATCEVMVTQTQAYAVLSNDGKTVTFYYDDKKESRGGVDIINSQRGTATTAVFDTSFANYRPTSTAYWFSGCSELTTIKGMENLYTDDVTDMQFMFYGCNNLRNLNIEGFNTEKVTSMYSMFCRCLSLEELDVSGFKMDNVTNTNRMFGSCYCLTTLDLSSFNTSNVKDMTRMFSVCKSLTTIYVNEKKWNTANVTEGDGVFADCTVLVGGNGTKFDESHTDVEYARIDKPGSPGYFTDIADSKVTGITLNKTTLSLQTNQAETLTATVMPDKALDKTVTWSSSNTNIASVDNSGKVTAVSAGTATITCTANGGSNVKATCEVTVTNPKPEKITLPAEATVKAGETITLTPTMTPENAVTMLTWTSDDETIATVDANGVVTGVKKGKTFINVETDNGKTAYCKLTVTASEPIAIELPKNATVTVGGTLTLTPTITPEGAETVLTWTSDDESVARVDVNGVLTGVAEGLALVTVSTSNGLTSNVCKVKVEQDPSGISMVLMGEKKGTPIYTPSGQRLAAPRKGINIVGGKKIVIK